MVADAISKLRNNLNQDTTHESTDTTETISELYEIKELSEETFTLSLKLIYCYQQEDPFLTERLKCTTYQKGAFGGVRNTI